MRKIILLLSCSFLFFSCKDCPKCPEEKVQPGASSPKKIGSLADAKHAFRDTHVTYPCDSLIPLMVDNIPNYPVWLGKNSKYLWTGKQPATSCSGKVKFFVLSRIPEASQANWLKEIQDYICYDDISDMIECHHLMDVIADDDAPVGMCSSMNWGQFKNQIGAAYTSERYARHVDITACTASGITIALNPYNPLKNCFSMPFLRSIEHNNGLVASDMVYFYQVDPGRYIFVVHDTADHVYLIYNFSNVPPFTGSMLKFPPI